MVDVELVVGSEFAITGVAPIPTGLQATNPPEQVEYMPRERDGFLSSRSMASCAGC